MQYLTDGCDGAEQIEYLCQCDHVDSEVGHDAAAHKFRDDANHTKLINLNMFFLVTCVCGKHFLSTFCTMFILLQASILFFKSFYNIFVGIGLKFYRMSNKSCLLKIFLD